jgi:hypothetical protein
MIVCNFDDASMVRSLVSDCAAVGNRKAATSAALTFEAA